MREIFRSCLLSAALLPALACGSQPTPRTPLADRLRLDALEAPTPTGASVPRLHATDLRTYLSWMERGAEEGPALRFASLDHGATAWSTPSTITSGPDLLVNWADFPSLVALDDGTLAAHWMRLSGPRGYDYEIWTRLSADGGSTWEPPFKLHRDDVAAEHGFVTMVPDAAGRLTAIWLDGRETVAAESDPNAERGAMALRAATVSSDGTLGEELLLDERICDCCQTDAALVDGRLVAVYRDRSPEEIRDIYAVTRGSDGWEAPVRVADDGWQIPGCPVNGPAIGSHEATLAVAWFTLIDGVPQVRLALSDDGARSFAAPIVVEAGSEAASTLGRVDLGWIDDRIVLTWITDIGGEAEVRYALFHASGTELDRGIAGTTSPARASGFPRMATNGEDGWLVWLVPGEAPRIELRHLSLDRGP